MHQQYPQRQSRPRAAKTEAIKRIAAICALEAKEYPECENDFIIYRHLGHFSKFATESNQFPLNETQEEVVARLTAQLNYYKKHPYVSKDKKKPIIVRFISYLKKLFK